MKRVLLDENLPRKLRRDFPEFAIRTVQEENWTSLANGELLGRAQDRFEVLLTEFLGQIFKCSPCMR